MSKELSNNIENNQTISTYSILAFIALLCFCAVVISVIAGIIIMISFFIGAPGLLDIFFTVWAVIYSIFSVTGIIITLIAMHLYVKTGGELM